MLTFVTHVTRVHTLFLHHDTCCPARTVERNDCRGQSWWLVYSMSTNQGVGPERTEFPQTRREMRGRRPLRNYTQTHGPSLQRPNCTWLRRWWGHYKLVSVLNVHNIRINHNTTLSRVTWRSKHFENVLMALPKGADWSFSTSLSAQLGKTIKSNFKMFRSSCFA